MFLTGVVGASVILLVLAVPFLQGRVYVVDDLPSFHLPWRALYAQSLSAGENFLWFPQLLGGYYAHGEGQAGMLHPFHLLIYRALPLQLAFGLELIASYAVMLGGMFLFLRRWGQDRVPAVFGAIVFSFSGFNLMQFVHPNLVSVLAHTPWILLAIEVAMTSPDPRRVAGARLAVGLLTASQILLGHPHALWLSAALEMLYVLARTRGMVAPWQRLSGLLVCKLLGVLAGGMQALPTWDAVSTSGRALAAPSEGYFSLVPADLTQLVQPYLSQARV
jgi:hypothetical protein